MFQTLQVAGPMAPGQYQPMQVSGPSSYYPMQTTNDWSSMFSSMMPMIMMVMMMSMMIPMFKGMTASAKE